MNITIRVDSMTQVKKISTVVFHFLYKQFINENKLNFLSQVDKHKIKILKDQKNDWKKFKMEISIVV